MTSTRYQQIMASLRDKDYRDALAEEQINTGLPFQIRAMRHARNWTQAELGQRTDIAQETISLFESAAYGRFSLRTLRRLASAFDVWLDVHFAPFSALADRMSRLSPEDLAVPNFETDAGLDSTDIFMLTGDTTSAIPGRESEAFTTGPVVARMVGEPVVISQRPPDNLLVFHVGRRGGTPEDLRQITTGETQSWERVAK